MSLLPVLTNAGRAKLQAAQGTAQCVTLTKAALGATARVPTGQELALASEICRTAIGGHTLDPVSGQLNLGVYFDGSVLGIGADRTITEVGFFDQDNTLIYYWSTAQGSLGSITSQSGYALALTIALSQADASIIQIHDDGSAPDLVLGPRMQAVEAGLAAVVLQLPAAGAAAAKQADVDALALGLAAAAGNITTLQGEAPAGGGRAAAAADLTALSAHVEVVRRRAYARALVF